MRNRKEPIGGLRILYTMRLMQRRSTRQASWIKMSFSISNIQRSWMWKLDYEE